jgi:hypothetical protein
LVDDFLAITTSRVAAEAVLNRLHQVRARPDRPGLTDWA